MGGRIFAESDGQGEGACLHLLMPRAMVEDASLEKANERGSRVDGEQVTGAYE